MWITKTRQDRDQDLMDQDQDRDKDLAVQDQDKISSTNNTTI